jgi:peptidyl-dipeptidase A
MLGELLASQLHHHIIHEVFELDSDEGVSYVGNKALGDYLRRRVLGPGARYQWNDMIERATGEPLTPEYFVEQFVE